MTKLKCIVVDDEALARRLMEENIRQVPFLELISTCKNPFEAMEVLQQEKIDLVFLDIQMPGMLGTKFLESLVEKPMVIFVTAYSNYAVESYDLSVVDYLMKPVSLERFVKAAHKAYELHQTKSNSKTPHTSDTPDYFFVNVEYSLVKITISEILFVEGLKDYVKIFLQNQTRAVLTKATMKSIEERLTVKNFMRVHRSYIVNLDKIESIRGKSITIQKHEIPVSESQIDELLKTINYTK
ncbi:MAG: LytTR family DNA-binding domain-containing protein [Spirosomaceae bacterium]|jgi:DNA-binding LytR/AlgR family response regulator|nr:LytTR family DNA-binding domain-containing protein [Spirosomataceae bacterium]